MDMPIIDRVFDMESGYVLDFMNRAFATTYDMPPAKPRWKRSTHCGNTARQQASPSTIPNLETRCAQQKRARRSYPYAI